MVRIDMRFACNYTNRMSMLQVRNVPPDLHHTLKARAALSGMSLSEFVLKELERIAERPTVSEFRKRLSERPPVEPATCPAEILADERDRH